jgi:hypothetical protein
MNLNLRQYNKPQKLINDTKLKIILVENTWLPFDARGWGNGYVDLPKTHPMYGVQYDDINVDVHGGLTYSEEVNGMWRVGFDTAHAGDNYNNWNKQKVYKETKYLAEQLSQME